MMVSNTEHDSTVGEHRDGRGRTAISSVVCEKDTGVFGMSLRASYTGVERRLWGNSRD
jgi:hypothetical protein